MAIIINGANPPASNKALGPEEAQLLDALHGRGELGERLKKDLERTKNRAKYKIEIQFDKNRSTSVFKMGTALIMVWESGRRFHGGGDQRMMFCGYWPGQGFNGSEECGKPIKDENFSINHLVCPHCHREQFLDPQVKKRHIQLAIQNGQDASGLEHMPVANPMLLAKLGPKSLAVFVSKIFKDLGANADIYVKYHPEDIRGYDIPDAKKDDVYEKARRARTEKKENRGIVIYPLENIIKDTMAGASIESRFQALFLA